jgi:hypothetical protein
MVDLLRRKSRHAVSYHSRLKLGDRPFYELLVHAPEDFVQYLASSRWITPGQPEASQLLTKLVAFGGPMFRVFSDAELAAIAEWIRSLPSRAVAPAHPEQSGQPVADTDSASDADPAADSDPVTTASAVESKTPSPGLGARMLYHDLLNAEDHPEALHEARAFAEAWLARAARAVEKQPDPLPFRTYTHAALRGWFDERAAAQARSYAGEPAAIGKSKEDVIAEAIHLCPMIFIDGAWIQRWSNAGLVETPVGALLYKIFSDEIGNGETHLNHPNIYRDLMVDMGVSLPDFRSREFAESPLFDDASFEIPAFWLSVSQFPRRFLPETLGLNLAMELSGVGGAYRTARDELRHHGFNTLFVELHNTIDNVSSGHSAMALKAIEIYMDGALSACDAAVTQMHWRRVWSGFRALAIQKRRWIEALRPPRYSPFAAYA